MTRRRSRVNRVFGKRDELARRQAERPGGPTIPMNDDKRFLRKLKRDLERVGNRKWRRLLRVPEARPEKLSSGRDRTDVMNERPARIIRPPAAGERDAAEKSSAALNAG